jgi:CRISPR-associated protein Csd1
MSAYLDKTNEDPAYVAGRVVAVIEKAQELAIGEVQSGVIKRHLGGVLASPNRSLVPLLKLALIAYIPKIEGYRAKFLDDLLGELHAQCPHGWPASLSTEGSGALLLGYFQQRAWLRDTHNLPLSAAHIHRTARGLWVRSKGEKRVAELLDKAEVRYVYEPRAVLDDGPDRFPDFFVPGASTRDAGSGAARNDVYVEYLGMSTPEYDRRWDAKLAQYKTKEITPAGGTAGRLVVIDDRDPAKRLDDPAILALLTPVLSSTQTLTT